VNSEETAQTTEQATPEPAPDPTPEPGPVVRRIVANLSVDEPAGDTAFWTDVVGLETAMDLGWVVNHREPRAPAGAQVQLISRDASAPVNPAVSVEVADAATLVAVHARAVAAGHAIVHPLTDEPWGVRRFFVRTPQGTVVNVLTHV
jgi:catechol 2,3-dioxygenase-like lactoylglutathione lyase family enzyme